MEEEEEKTTALGTPIGPSAGDLFEPVEADPEEEGEFTYSSNFNTENSRTSLKEMQEDLVKKKENDFDAVRKAHARQLQSDFGRKSTLVFARKKTADQKEVSLEDFEIVSVLGRGTFGKVYLGNLKMTNTLYAIKAIRKDILIETEQIESTRLERNILLSCDHPFLVGMEFVFQTDLRLYFVMKFVKGGELYKLFLKKRRFPEEQVKFYALQIAEAIGYLHAQNIIHRDLKLENILVEEDGYLAIIDFGLAKMLDKDAEASSFCGTPEYLSPEMVAQLGHDKTVDWWALGVLM